MKQISNLVTYRWFSPSTLVSSINKTSRHDIAEILLKVALNTINRPSSFSCISSTLFLTRMSIAHVHGLFQLSLSGWCEMILMIEDLILINQCSFSLLICICHKSLITLLHNVVSDTSALSGVRTHNVRGDRRWLLR
jgi:hypothetical protein